MFKNAGFAKRLNFFFFFFFLVVVPNPRSYTNLLTSSKLESWLEDSAAGTPVSRQNVLLPVAHESRSQAA